MEIENWCVRVMVRIGETLTSCGQFWELHMTEQQPDSISQAAIHNKGGEGSEEGRGTRPGGEAGFNRETRKMGEIRWLEGN